MVPAIFPIARIAVLYLIFGTVWIVFSDQWVAMLVSDPDWVTRLQTVKGGLFVVVTGLMLFLLIRRGVQQHHDLMRRDDLTGLLNRAITREAVDSQIARAKLEHQTVAFFCLDIDGFRNVNAALGTKVADELLVLIAQTLQSDFGDRAVLGRGGADEFVVSMVGSFNEAELNTTAQKLRVILRRIPPPDDGVAITGTVGVAVFPQHGATARALFAASKVAIERARVFGLGFSVFCDAFKKTTEERSQLLKELTQAVRQNAMTLVYQPQFKACGKRCCGVEALVRWHHPERGWVSPSEFIPLAEQNGLVRDITDFVVARAVSELTEKNLLGKEIPRLSINLSAHDFDDAAHIDRLVRWLGQNRPVCQYLQFEITETGIMHNLAQAVSAMKKLRALGVRFSIDDFGTGYSSLSMLKALPVTELKVDRSFIADLPDDVSDAHLVRTMIVMAHSLSLSVMAEGVENEAQRHFLQENHCNALQGFLLARPQPLAELQVFLNGMVERA